MYIWEAQSDGWGCLYSKVLMVRLQMDANPSEGEKG